MPLMQGKSDSAFTHNLKAEMQTKPRDQALAIAYAVKRKNAKKMAEGGMYREGGEIEPTDAPMSIEEAMEYEHSKEDAMKMSKGGSFLPAKNMAKMIMAKRMAGGGMVDSEEAMNKGLEMEEPMGMLDESDDESMPLDHASMNDDFLTAEDKESEMGDKKKDLLSRIMMRL